MLLILTASTDATATYLAERLSAAATAFLRLDTDTCVDHVRVAYTQDAGPALIVDGSLVRASEITNLWLRRPREIAVAVDCDAAERMHVANELGD